ncbi:MAG TPA: heavy-metal-associated domain-containing protein [Kiritimatiellia bacterium]|nr:heavy-metal-associated domain-containing protein [Kiritimatiellia bacterium]HRZ13725.1 heavy-metal-associated domain-containing protein [Kiritimatiellia bacterium]HSA19367.1 heavy-metal-associated domain-containing protein [Kiritimatiellia bacterium]
MKTRHFCIGLFLAVTAFLAAASGCYRRDIRTLEVKVPQMGSPECARIVETVFNKMDGIEQVDIDLANRRILVKYDGLKMGIVNIEYLLTNAGFDANDKPARPEARAKLPPECR